jgi:hypothetical protein
LRASIATLIILSGCAQSDETAECPWFSAGALHSAPTTYLELRDNAEQCEMYWLVRFTPLDGSVSDAVEGAMSECRLERELAHRTGLGANQPLPPLPAYLTERRSELIGVAMRRRAAECARKK